MNLKVGHLVAIQFGIFIGIVFCLVFFRFESARPRTAAEMRELATERAAAVERMSEPTDERADMADNREKLEPAEPLSEQPVPAMPNEYSPEAVEKSMAILTKLYYEQIAPRRNAASSPANTAVAPSYTEVAQEPETAQIDGPAPQNVAYVQPTQFIVYPQPVQVVVFSHNRRFVSRRGPHRHPDSGGTHLSGLPEFESPASPSAALRRPPGILGLEQRRTGGVLTGPSLQGFTPRGKR